MAEENRTEPVPLRGKLRRSSFAKNCVTSSVHFPGFFLRALISVLIRLNFSKSTKPIRCYRMTNHPGVYDPTVSRAIQPQGPVNSIEANLSRTQEHQLQIKSTIPGKMLSDPDPVIRLFAEKTVFPICLSPPGATATNVLLNPAAKISAAPGTEAAEQQQKNNFLGKANNSRPSKGLWL
ncbi:uncharacterized protein LOC129738008 [Uranotaenia lowii]|uniref:uncharacterized protein LOC129738008 n=1 Tax=Uranotaenia lowii TaxID=190385 RepID=UPI002478DE05|nr:uncharacterized protein LOC129738008 [Uranotaenia lowii]